MLDFVQKRKLRTLMYHRTTLIVLGCIVALMLHSLWGVYKKKQESEALKQLSSEQVALLQGRLAEITDDMNRLSTREGEEEEIRAKYNVVKPNERMVVIVPDASTTASSTPSSQGMWNAFLGLFRPKHK